MEAERETKLWMIINLCRTIEYRPSVCLAGEKCSVQLFNLCFNYSCSLLLGIGC
jgi:hypothetical protein